MDFNRRIAFLPALCLGLAISIPLASPAKHAVGQSTAAAPKSDSETFTMQEDVLYGSVEGTALHLDVYQPAGGSGGARPAVVLIHGGGWSSLDRRTMRNMGQFLARSGFVAFAVDYRLLQGRQGRWPAQLDDVQRAVRWVRANASKYSVNPARIGAFGHSSGAQLAALLGMEDTRDNSDASLAKFSSKVQAVVDVSGPTDFTQDHEAADGFLSNFLGAPFSERPEVWREASPAYHVAKDNAPFLIVHGTQDDHVPMSQAQELYEKLQSAGVPASLIKVNDGHTFQTPEARHQLAIESLGFFNRYLVVAQQ